MGKCNSKNKPKPVNVEKLFAASKGNNKTVADKSEFYYFVQWILSFDFYKRLPNSKSNVLDLAIREDPKKSTMFKIIKAIDSLNERDKFSVFSVYNNNKKQQQQQMEQMQKEQSKQKRKGKEKDKQANGINNINIERETLKCLFFHLAKNDASKLRNILINGPPNNIRWLIWISIAKTDYETIHSQLNITNEQVYQSMLNKKIEDSIKVAILKDINRTNSSKYFMNNFNYQTSLTNILNAIAIYDNQLGYCLGMNSISANSLLVSDFNEDETFQFLRYLYSIEYGLKLREFFIEGLPRINYYAYIITQLTEIRLPLIYDVIKKIKLDKTMWIVKWLQTLFSFLKLSLAVRLWDCIIALGFNFLIKFSLGCLKYCEYDIINNDQISNENFNDIVVSKINDEKVIKYALSFRIGKETKMKYEQMFFADLIRNEGNGDDDDEDEDKKKIVPTVQVKEEVVVGVKEEDKDAKPKEDNKEEGKCNEDIVLINEEKEKAKTDLNQEIINEEMIYKAKINKIKAIYNQVFKKEDILNIKQIITINSEAKTNALKQMKSLYFGELSTNEEPYEDETKLLCSLSGLTYEHYQKQFEKELLQRHVRKKSSNMIVNNKFNTYTKNSSSLNLKFKSTLKHHTLPSFMLKNNSILEDKKEYSSILSDDNENFYSISKGKLSDFGMSNNKGSSCLSVKFIDENPIDENEEEEKTILEGEEIEPILQENQPMTVLKANLSPNANANAEVNGNGNAKVSQDILK